MTDNEMRGDPHLKDTMLLCQKVEKMLEAGANCGQITPEDYKKML